MSTRSPPAPILLGLAAVGLSSLVAIFVLIASGGPDRPIGGVALHVLVIAAPLATGLYAVRNPRTAWFGWLLILAGFAWSFAGWLLVPILAYLLLSFPEGRLRGRRERFVLGSLTALIALACAASALVGDGSPPLEVPAALLLLGVTIALGVRARRASAMGRATAVPVFAVSTLTTLVPIAFIIVPGDTLREMWMLCLPAVAAAFSFALVWRRMLIGSMLGAMSGALSASLDPRPVEAVVRSTMRESALDLLIHDRDREVWVREDGSVVDPVELAASGLGVHEVVDASGPVAAVLIDDRLDDGDELTDAIVSLAEAALREAKLTADLETSLDELDDSRKRIATATELERRRIERDLHDGAQQRLIALRMRLSLAEDLLRDDAVAASDAIHDLGDDVDHALDEIRALAHGIYPALLADRGLADALRSFARRAPVPVQVTTSGLTRHPPEIESAVYFTCLEALQNAAKHARGATGARMELRQAGALDFEISDDGEGFDPAQATMGAGFRNMRDRVESLGGTLSVVSAEGLGTVVTGTVPLRRTPSRHGRTSPVQPPMKHRSRETERDRKPERQQAVRKRRQKRVGR